MSTSGVFSTLDGYHEYIGGVQYIGGYHDTCGDTMSTLGDVQYIGGYHEYIGGCSVHQGMFSTLEFSIEIDVLNIP